jgi:hypothetical protein
MVRRRHAGLVHARAGLSDRSGGENAGCDGGQGDKNFFHVRVLSDVRKSAREEVTSCI